MDERHFTMTANLNDEVIMEKPRYFTNGIFFDSQ